MNPKSIFKGPEHHHTSIKGVFDQFGEHLLENINFNVNYHFSTTFKYFPYIIYTLHNKILFVTFSVFCKIKIVQLY